MQATNPEKIRLGVFLVTGVLVILAIVIFYTGLHFTNHKIRYHTRLHESVDGLVPGAKVKWNGVSIGQVLSIEMDHQNLKDVIVIFEVQKTTPIKASMRANLAGGFSITGLKTIELTGGTPLEKDLPEDSEVLSIGSQIQNASNYAEVLIVKIDTLISHLLELSNSNNQQNVTEALSAIGTISTKLSRIDFESHSKQFSTVLNGIAQTNKHTDQILYRVQDDLVMTFKNLSESSQNIEEFTNTVKNNPSLLIYREEKWRRAP